VKHPWLRSNTAAWIIALLVILVIHPLMNQLTRRGLQWRAERVWEQSKPALAQDLRTLDPVLHALEQYRIDHEGPKALRPFAANYPATLQDLVPRYLKALPGLPPTLRKLEYKLITARQCLMPPPPPTLGMAMGANAPVGSEIIIPLSGRATFGQFLGTEPRGTLVYSTQRSMVTPDTSGKTWGRPDDRLAGWDYYALYRHSSSLAYIPTALDPRQEALRPYREARLKAVEPVAKALRWYWADHVERPDHPPTHPETLQALVPRYLPALPKLPPVFGPLHYKPTEHGFILWVRLDEQVTGPSGKPLDISGTFLTSLDGSGPSMLMDTTDPTSRPLRPVVTGMKQWTLYD
jgi:hypothetical protein